MPLTLTFSTPRRNGYEFFNILVPHGFHNVLSTITISGTSGERPKTKMS